MLAFRPPDLRRGFGSPAAARTAHDKTALQRQIEATDRQIDRLVYELYGLTEDEIRIVEAATDAYLRGTGVRKVKCARNAVRLSGFGAW
ncbi:MAG: hypothetical protein CHACPFDD_00836 [Phycisphaerae bacterium]|nr:hypothetical protein [Phycisphaerae bacterium]